MTHTIQNLNTSLNQIQNQNQLQEQIQKLSAQMPRKANEGQKMLYLDAKETKILIKNALKEAFPSIKFSMVKRDNSLSIGWTDGVTTAQVDKIISIFKGASFDGMTDSEDFNYVLLNGVRTNFYYKYIFLNRNNSDLALENALDSIYERYEFNFKEKGFNKPTLADFKNGSLTHMQLFNCSNENISRLVYQFLSKN